MKQHAQTFIDILLAAMKDAAVSGELSQLRIQFDPTETGKGPLKMARVIVVPEDMEFNWPSYAPAGTPQG